MDSLYSLVGVALALVLCTSFLKMFVALSIVRAGFGGGIGLGIAGFALALALTLVVVQPQFAAFGGMDGALKGSIQVTPNAFSENLRPFLERHTDTEVRVRLQSLLVKKGAAGTDAGKPAKPPADEEVLVAAFLVSELRDAFTIGLLFILPFVVIDLLVVNVLAALGVTTFSAAIVSLPLKILLFLAVDGWVLLSERLLGGYL